MKGKVTPFDAVGALFKGMGMLLLGLSAFCMGFFKSTKRSSY